MKTNVNEAIKIMADKAISIGETIGNDNTGIVRAIVEANGLGFNAWFCVCCEIADRNAQAEGFKNQGERAASKMSVMQRPSIAAISSYVKAVQS